MTNMPEAKLAREAELCYASIAMITDFDCWHPDHGAVDVAQVISVLNANAGKAKALVSALAKRLGPTRPTCKDGCDHALDNAIMTAPNKRDPALLAKLNIILTRVLDQG